MKEKQKVATALVAFTLLMSAVVSLFSPGLFQVATAFANTNVGSAPSSVSYHYPEQICALPGNNISSSIYYSRTPDIKTTDPGVFLEDKNNGNLYWCSIDNTGFAGNLTLIGQAPKGGRGGGYWGMGGYDTGGPIGDGVILVLTSYDKHGMWFCYWATYQTCLNNESAFITFPSSYCGTLATKECDPYGTALDGNLNVYWVDPKNAVFTECTSASNYTNCFTLTGPSFFGKQKPMGLALINNTSPYLSPTPGWSFYITDTACKGLIWEGNGTTTYPLATIAKLNDSIQGIGTTTKDVGNMQQLLVGDTGSCSDTPAKVIDLSNSSQTVPTNFQAPSSIIGISVCWGQCLQDKQGSWQLFYTGSNSGTVWVSEGQVS